MPLLIGTDEAGYGPNLGPLVVGASMWQVPTFDRSLFDLLSEVVCDAANEKKADQDRIPIGDSKALYQSGGSLETIERSVVSLLCAMNRRPTDLFNLFGQLCNCNDDELLAQATFGWSDVTFPVANDIMRVEKMGLRTAEGLKAAGVKCQDLSAEMVFADSFNQAMDRYQNKATLLSITTCQMVRRLIDKVDVSQQDDEPLAVLVLCDKHGGRSRYAGLIQEFITQHPIVVCQESREISIYRWRENGICMEIRFVARGEQHLPVALASMVAKYLREISMNAWNSFWCQRLPNVKPTAGYPVDAQRFKTQIAELQHVIGVSDESIWRCK